MVKSLPLEKTAYAVDSLRQHTRLTRLSLLWQVGAATETELEDRKLRIEDAKNATFAAVEEVRPALCRTATIKTDTSRSLNHNFRCSAA